ncbi:YraN family protein [bacterium]|nr:YraN family protein [bacterium]
MKKQRISAKKIGVLGEKIATGYLQNKGYKILDRNYYFKTSGSFQKGEIDIVAKKDDVISFIEVKTLQDSPVLISPEEKVNFIKQRKLKRAAESWLIKRKIPLESKWQIDVIAIKLKGKEVKIDHFKNVISEQ